PSNSGSRRSRRARPYSWKSSERLASSMARASSVRWRSRSAPRPRWISSFERPTATVAAEASSSTRAPAGSSPAAPRTAPGLSPAPLPAEHEHLLGARDTGETREQPRSARVGREAHRSEGSAHARIVGDHGEVGRKEQMQAEPDYPSAGGGDDRGLRLEHRRDEPVHLPAHAPLRGTDAGLVAAAAFTEVEARAEVLAGTGESEHAHGLVAARRFDDLDEGVHHFVGECVAADGPVE